MTARDHRGEIPTTVRFLASLLEFGRTLTVEGGMS
jgi:hypothetical protein